MIAEARPQQLEFEGFTDPPTEPARRLKRLRTDAREIRDRLRDVTEELLWKLETGVDDSISVYRAIGRVRERIVWIEERLFDVERAMSNLVRGRANDVDCQAKVASRVERLLVRHFGESFRDAIRAEIERCGLVPHGRSTADPFGLSRAMLTRLESDEYEEPNGLVAGQYHGFDDDRIDADRDLRGLDTEDW
ncbi:MAG: hypothetical protein RL885_24865 [Planctomycetota bacterium]